jgi:hypothetical protein
MHSLEMIVRMNCAKQVRKLRRANLLFNLGSAGHAKSEEKTGSVGQALNPGWITEEQWQEEKKRKKKSRRYS